MAIAKTASINVAFKVTRMGEAIMEDQDCTMKCTFHGSRMSL